MTVKELEGKADAYLQASPGITPKEIYINAFIAGYRFRDEADKENPKLVLRIDYDGIKALWRDHCPAYGELRTISEKRKEKVRSRWKEFAELGDPITVCVGLFDKMQASAFLRGGNNRGWKANFDWLFDNSNNWVKVYEGRYDDRLAEATTDKSVNAYWDNHYGSTH
jgi:hypothetical protein